MEEIQRIDPWLHVWSSWQSGEEEGSHCLGGGGRGPKNGDQSEPSTIVRFLGSESSISQQGRARTPGVGIVAGLQLASQSLYMRRA